MKVAFSRYTVLLACLACTLPAAVLADGARDWLKRMETAVESLSYEGTFVHMVGNRMETMHVIHRRVGGEVAERLFSLDQPGREILRHNDRVTCIFADQRMVLVERRRADRGTPLISSFASDTSAADEWYEFREAGTGHKLGRVVQVIEIQPRDSFRYGHRLWLDKATAMPLKVQLLDPDGVAVEQIQFVSMLMSAEISDARLQPDVEIDGFTWYKHDQPRTPFDSDPGSVAWVLKDPPPGFHLTQARVRTLPGADHPVEHLVFSDGLASVSIFVEPANEADGDLAGLSRMGAAHAFTLTLDGQQITAVGEVPPDTVQRIARALRPAAVASQ